MRVLITGHNGYIGSVMGDVLRGAGHEIVGLDTYLFEACVPGAELVPGPAIRKDIRDVETSDLAGFDAVIHLAALSNDQLGALNPKVTYDINHRASVRLARLAGEAGVQRFLFASSCSLYRAAADQGLLTEEADLNPATPYGESKVLVERDVSRLATDRFSPVFLRNAVVYGVSPRFRSDVVVHSLVGGAVSTGEVRIHGDDTAWQPLVHVEDVARAFLAALEAPRGLIHNRAFNVGRTRDNYQIRAIAQIVTDIVPGSRITSEPDAARDQICYRVDCDEIAWTLPAFQPRWDLREGVRELYEAYRRHDVTYDRLAGGHPDDRRIGHLRQLQAHGLVDEEFRWASRFTGGASLNEQTVAAIGG